MIGTPSVRDKREKAREDGARFVIPPFVNYEIWRGLMAKPVPEHEMAYAIICDNCFIGEMNAGVWMCGARIYADLYAKRFTVSDSDILIAAYCIANDCTLVTANTKDFENIEGLRVVNWVE
jgi:predicted nucleic acid-binding protein